MFVIDMLHARSRAGYEASCFVRADRRLAVSRRRNIGRAAGRRILMERQNRVGVMSLALKGAVGAYQLLVSPLLPPSCRFLPSCSEYAAGAIERHGALRGSALALRRLARCHPWGGSGYDPVPEPVAFDRLSAGSGR
jgi:uncharacterized protein